MGVPIGEATGDHVTLCDCTSCGTRFETDETMTNDCPHCGSSGFDVVDGTATNPDLSWRQEVA